MTTYYRTVLVYMLLATALTFSLHDDMPAALQNFVNVAGGYIKIIGGTVKYVVPGAILLIWLFGRRLSLSQLRQVYLAGVASVMLQAGFLLFKSAIPLVVPFYADPFWAELDRSLLFGHDAWQLAQVITPDLLSAWFPHIYLSFWSLLAYSFPLLLVATDPDDSRVLRYSWLFFLSWVVTGNLLALAGSSVGPVYYDHFLGTQRFADMRAVFDQIGFSRGPLAAVQAHLLERSRDMLSYISAFPSVHVAVAGIAALYLHERSRFLWPVGVLFTALILLISVYTGYHYLVDGIASLGIVLALSGILRRVMGRAAAQKDLRGQSGAGVGKESA